MAKLPPIGPSLKSALVLGVIVALMAQLGFLFQPSDTIDLPPLALAAPEHAYFRPPADRTSGWPNSTAQYHRSPCPALNSLANHGFLPRDGKNVSQEMIRSAIMLVFAIDPLLATVTGQLLERLPPQFTLADLSTHDFLERDASLVHDDAFFQKDPILVNLTLAAQLLERATGDGPADERLLTTQILARYRRDRTRESAESNPAFHLLAAQRFQIMFEAASLLVVMGDRASATISARHARSFLVHERIPSNFQRSEQPITTARALRVILELQMRAWLL